MSKLEKLVEDLSTLTVLEASELSKLLEEKWGVSAAAPVAVAAAGGGAAAPAAEAAEEQTEFTVVLENFGANKVGVIKAVREITGLGLKEAKAVVDEAPKPIKEAVTKEEADKIAAKMAEVGAKVTIK